MGNRTSALRRCAGRGLSLAALATRGRESDPFRLPWIRPGRVQRARSEHARKLRRLGEGVSGRSWQSAVRELNEVRRDSDRGIRGASCRHGRPEAAAVGGWLSQALSPESGAVRSSDSPARPSRLALGRSAARAAVPRKRAACLRPGPRAQRSGVQRLARRCRASEPLASGPALAHSARAFSGSRGGAAQASRFTPIADSQPSKPEPRHVLRQPSGLVLKGAGGGGGFLDKGGVLLGGFVHMGDGGADLFDA
jgi:hypothetical protein